MSDANLVRFGESVGDLRRDCNCVAKWNRATGEQFTHRLPLHQFHRDVARAVDLPEFINRNNIGMVDRTLGTGLLLQTHYSFRLRTALQRKSLNRDFTFEATG